MSADILKKLYQQRSTPVTVTVKNIVDQISNTKQAGLSETEEIIQYLKNKLPKKLSSLKKENKLRQRLTELLQDNEYTLNQLKLIDLACLKDDGRIDTEELDFIINTTQNEQFKL